MSSSKADTTSNAVKAASTTPSSSIGTTSSTSLSSSTSTTSITSTTHITTSITPSSTSSTTSISTVSPTSTHHTVSVESTTITVNGSPTTSPVSTSSYIAKTSSRTSSGGSTSSSSAAAISNNGHNGGHHGLSTGATTAIAVIIPVAVIALLIGLGIVFWRTRKQKREAEDLRRKEMEEYSYNPHGDPTLPAIGSDAGGLAMTEDHGSGYRGWGATTASNRKLSTTLSGGHTQQFSDSGHSYGQPSPPHGAGAFSDAHSSDPIVVDHNNEELGALGVTSAAAGGAAMGAAAAGRGGLRRGPSNASSAYSGGNQSEGSEERPPMPGASVGQAYDYNPGGGYGYGQHGPYGDGTYGGGQSNGMPVVQDLNARRNTRIQPGGSYQQGNSGIAQNF